MADEAWRIMGMETVPLWVTGNISTSPSAGGGTTVISGNFGSGAIAVFEQTFGNNANELFHYETSFAIGRNGLETTASVYAGAARIYEIVGVNRTTGTLFLQVFDLTGGPGPGQRPIYSLPVLSASEKGFSWRTGRFVSTGIQLGWSSEYASFTGSANAGAIYVDYKR